MNPNWSDGYFTEIAYTHGYYRELSPVLQRFCLLLRGIAPPAGHDPAHCELGFGQGISANVHAATVPGVYVGTDFNPQQAAFAAALAHDAGSGARLYDDSFAQLLDRPDLPQFDSISLHGIWSWISPDNRAVIVEFARRHLKPGGMFYVSYNCLPGWAGAAPLRQLFALRDRFAGDERLGGDRVDEAVGFARRLLAAKPRYAATIPGLEERLERIAAQDRNYLAHEYLNKSWNVGYFTDVVDALADAKLEFAASGHAIDGLDGLHIAPEGLAFLATLPHPVMREQARDYFVNQQFRRDLFVRGARRLTSSERDAALRAERLVLVQPAARIAREITLPHGTAGLNAAIYQPLIDALAADAYAPKSLALLSEHAQASGISPVQLLEAVTVLVGMGAASPCQSEEAAAAAERSSRRLNLALMRHALHHENVAVLASPVTGGGVTVDRIGKLYLLAHIEGEDDAAAFAWRAFAAANQRMRKGDVVLQTPEENTAELRERMRGFEAEHLPMLKALGIV